MEDKIKEEERLIELKHKYHMEEIEAEKKAKMEVERLHHENELGVIRFKKASIDLTRRGK